tara:strand:+ start:1433 stop:1738 length:306 start_codon:yes stop_codon:yes gene_type:complete
MTTHELKTAEQTTAEPTKDELERMLDTLRHNEQVMWGRLRDAIAERDAVLDGPHPEDRDEVDHRVWHAANAHVCAERELAAAQRDLNAAHALEALRSGVAG